MNIFEIIFGQLIGFNSSLVEYFNNKRVYSLLGLEKKFKRERDDIFEKISMADVIYFGDSSITYCENNEINKSSITEIFCTKTKTNLYSFTSESMSPLLWYKIAKEAHKIGAIKNKIVIFNINMRYFSDDWYHRPNTRFVQSNFIFKKYKINRLISIFRIFYTDYFINQLRIKNDIQLSYNYNNILNDCRTLTDVYQLFKKTINKEEYEKIINYFYYGYDCEILKKRVYELDCFIKTLKKAKCKIFIYITPISVYNFNKITLNNCKKNIDYIKTNIINKYKNINFYDYHDLLDNSSFYHREHYNYKGRETVAENLAKEFKYFVDIDNRIKNFELYNGAAFFNINNTRFIEIANTYIKYKYLYLRKNLFFLSKNKKLYFDFIDYISKKEICFEKINLFNLYIYFIKYFLLKILIK